MDASYKQMRKSSRLASALFVVVFTIARGLSPSLQASAQLCCSPSFSVTPSILTAGDSSLQMNFSGSNLLSSDGSFPDVTVYPTDVSINIDHGNSTSLIAYYSVEPETPPDLGFIVLTNSAGASTQVDITILANGAGSCPSSITVGSSQPMNLSPTDVANGYLTGIGALYSMNVYPSDTSYNGVSISESISQGSSDCPSTIPSAAVCTTGGGGALVIGQGTTGQQAYGIDTPQAGSLDTLLDAHAVGINPTKSLLQPGQSCTITCNQIYSCGSVNWDFTITYNFTTGTISGVPVTLVGASKQ